ncbi:hypothetical protein BCR44DRAFT_1448299 [Catenaria anguillulae PL171]|uniref:Uncharacterized protein n=1 Tax=Catenaria anguillulae PL171 TaxID=765915 RepID=A0A1Y2H6L7_9FUNG|nr:hypothetical protein BCR44DRAFT_1448299 [Catenaria anguillulae PL171]
MSRCSLCTFSSASLWIRSSFSRAMALALAASLSTNSRRSDATDCSSCATFSATMASAADRRRLSSSSFFSTDINSSLGTEHSTCCDKRPFSTWSL